jgi:hypothetical protein
MHSAVKKLLIVYSIILIVNCRYSHAQFSLIKKWDYDYGGTLDELFWGLHKTDDGGFILNGSSTSNAGGNITQPNWGMSYDMWIAKLDSSGLLQWQKRFGGTVQDRCQALAIGKDNQYLCGGFTQSDVSGDVTEPKFTTNFDTDYWTVLSDSVGNKIWDKRFGGTQGDFLSCITTTIDGNYLIGGSSLSDISGNKSENSRGVNDFWIVKIDSAGNKIWDKTFGGTLQEDMAGIAETGDKGFLLAGWSASGVGGDKTQSGYGDKDFWIVRIDSLGNKLWDKDYGGTGEDRMTTMTPLSNGEFILAGYIGSPQGNDISEVPRGGYDLWILKIDSTGNKIWDKRLGGTSDDDELGSVVATLDGGFLISGTSYSDTGADKSENNLGAEQAWAIKLDANGNKEWDRTIFSTGHDETSYAVQTEDSCYVFGVWSQGGIGGYKSQPNWCPGCFSGDFWIIKFCDSVTSSLTAAFTGASMICPGTCTDFINLSLGASSYFWLFPGSSVASTSDVNPVNICYNTPGSYDVTLIAGNGNSYDTLFIPGYVTVYPSPPPQSIMQYGDTLIALQGAVSYQWYYNGNIIPGATDYFHVAQSSGDYNVVATDDNECEVEAAIYNVIAKTDLVKKSTEAFFVWYNKVSNTFSLQCTKGNSQVFISLFNSYGELLLSRNTVCEEHIEFAAPNAAAGLYLFRIESEGHVFISKILINN